ncbi:MAG: DNA polymerase III subunit beta [Gammaproteobacteria bacterium]|nr:DNA polymerase III subunit beta [Gammaproteobacteria bacterium]
MFELTISKQQILTPLLMVAGAVDKKQSLPILSNILLQLSAHQFSLTATDLEIQITAVVPCSASTTGAVTVPAKKIIDIFRSLDEEAAPTLSYSGSTLTIKTEHSKFKLTTLPAVDYPIAEDEISELEFSLQATDLMRLLQATSFAMAQQDVRAYLNGLFLEIDAKSITAVTADGHRMAVCRLTDDALTQHHRLLIPKKGVQEMQRLLATVADERVVLSASKNHVSLSTSQFRFSSKLIEARFPPYTKAIPRDYERSVLIDRDHLKRALSRIVILANEKLRAVVLRIEHNALTLAASNKEQEEGTETLAVETQGEPLTIGLNATYLLDVLNYFNEGVLRLTFGSADSSILVQSVNDEQYQYIIMPMKL